MPCSLNNQTVWSSGLSFDATVPPSYGDSHSPTHTHTPFGAVSICRDRDHKNKNKIKKRKRKRNETERKEKKKQKKSRSPTKYGIPGRAQLWLDPYCKMAAATHCRLAEYNCIPLSLAGPDCPQRLVAREWSFLDWGRDDRGYFEGG